MPRNSPKTRVCFNLNGKPKQILSIRERSDESLILLLNPAAKFEHQDRSLEEVDQQRYSIHNSDDAAGNTIKQTVRLESGSLIESYQNSSFVEDQGFAFVYSRRLPSLAPEKFTLTSNRDKDRRVVLHDITQKTGTPVFGVFVSGKSTALSESDVTGFNVRSIPFKRYQIHILWTYIRLPSHHTGCLLHMMTMPRLIDKEEEPLPIPSDYSGYTKGVSSKEVALRMAISLNLHSQRMASDVIAAEYQNDPARAQDAITLSKIHSKSA